MPTINTTQHLITSKENYVDSEIEASADYDSRAFSRCLALAASGDCGYFSTNSCKTKRALSFSPSSVKAKPCPSSAAANLFRLRISSAHFVEFDDRAVEFLQRRCGSRRSSIARSEPVCFWDFVLRNSLKPGDRRSVIFLFESAPSILIISAHTIRLRQRKIDRSVALRSWRPGPLAPASIRAICFNSSSRALNNSAWALGVLFQLGQALLQVLYPLIAVPIRLSESAVRPAPWFRRCAPGSR